MSGVTNVLQIRRINQKITNNFKKNENIKNRHITSDFSKMMCLICLSFCGAFLKKRAEISPSCDGTQRNGVRWGWWGLS